ncbi:MAG: T9SS type A sorting domain-containing protein [Bacteroidetes bacterium]|nr:T9SS type A sorting domain-containing protein [Bacteroidota bacterium]
MRTIPVRKITLLVVFALLLAGNNGFSQFIMAGVAGNDDIYTDVTPDSSMCASMFDPFIPQYNMKIDLDKDGSYDLNIHVVGGGGLGGGSSSCTAIPLLPHTSLVARYDSVPGNISPWYVPVMDTLNPGDSISPANGFVNAYCYIWSQSFGGQNGPSVVQWTNTGEHYIGVRLTLTGETLYGWVRVAATDQSCISVKDYACNKGIHSAIKGQAAAEAPLLFPNPARSTVRLTWSGARREAKQLKVFSCIGKLCYQATCPPAESTTSLDVSAWPAGIYLLQTESGGLHSTQRLEVIH